MGCEQCPDSRVNSTPTKSRLKMVSKRSVYVSPLDQPNTPKFPTESEVTVRMVILFRSDFKRKLSWTVNRNSDMWKARYRIAYAELLAEKQKLYKLK